ncbi:MAG: hypothetical protein LUF78_09340 [Clostridiales bacterium]|nr:hypothetical protein [Clostridiales bacterium]
MSKMNERARPLDELWKAVEIGALFLRYDAAMPPQIDPACYEAILWEAEVLDNAT